VKLSGGAGWHAGVWPLEFPQLPVAMMMLADATPYPPYPPPRAWGGRAWGIFSTSGVRSPDPASGEVGAVSILVADSEPSQRAAGGESQGAGGGHRKYRPI